jgi:phage terminase small subunit
MKAAEQLRPMEELFVEAYVGVARLNGTESARLAGYKGDDRTLGVTAHRLLRRAKVKRAIAARLAKVKRMLSADEVLQEIASIALSLDAADRDRLKALELLGRHYKLFTDRTEHAIAEGVEVSPAVTALVGKLLRFRPKAA